jgi:hypothetical protein
MIASLVSMLMIASDPWIVTRADLTELTGPVVSRSPGSLRIDSGAGPIDIDWDDVVSLQTTGQPRVSDSRWLASLTTGERLAANDVELAGESLLLSTPHLGTQIVDIRRLKSLTRPWSNAAPAQTLDDVVELANGDLVRGIVERIDRLGVRVQTDEQAIDVALEEVAAVRLAPLPDAPTRIDAPFVLRLADGSTIGVDGVELTGSGLVVSGVETPVAHSHVRGIDHLRGRAVWFDLAGSWSMTRDPFFPSMSSSGAPLEPQNGSGGMLTMRSRSQAELSLVGGFRRFQSRFLVPTRYRGADVVVRVEVDGRTVFESPSRGPGESGDIDVDLTGAKTLKLVVDYGLRLDVDDVVEFSAAVLLR